MKKLVSLLLMTALLLSLCTFIGCSADKAKETTPGAATAPAGEEPAGEEPAGEEPAGEEPAVQLKGDKFKVVYAAVTTSLAPYVIVIANAFEEMCKRNDWDYEVYDGEGNPTVQTEQIDNIAADGDADLCVLFPVDSAVAVSYVKKLSEADITTFTLVSDVTEEGQSFVPYFITNDNPAYGKAQADYAIEKFGADAGLNYVILSGWQAQLDYQYRENGVLDGLKDTNYNHLNTAYCGASRDTAMETMAQYITTYGDDLDIVFCLSDEFALGAIQAIDAAGLTGKITVLSMEIFKESVDMIKQGKMDMSITQSGVELVGVLENTIKSWLSGEIIDRVQYLDGTIVTKENVDTVTPEY
jgi:ABC-type sugar transport system substrate-binding protein